MSHSTIRTFRAASVREALALVRGAFGPDAVVLQAREVPATLFRKAEFEVMAALDDSQIPGANELGSSSPSQAPQTAQPTAPPPTQLPPRKPPRTSSVDHLAPPVHHQPVPTQHQASALQPHEAREARETRKPAPMVEGGDPLSASLARTQALSDVNRPELNRYSSQRPSADSSQRLSADSTQDRSRHTPSAQGFASAPAARPNQNKRTSNAITPEAAAWFAQPSPFAAASEPAFIQEPGFSPPASSARSQTTRPAANGNGYSEWQEEVRDLRSALDEARAMLSSFSAQGRAGADSTLAPAASEANAQLIACGVDSSHAAQLIRAALAQGIPHETSAILEAARNLLATRLTADRAPWLRGGRHTLAFVGPTGVGKTTTLAKIAARALMEGNRKVGLITVDTYRIGASEQLARYGEIMGVPAFVAKNPRELAAAVERCSRCDLILIDTAGRSGPDQLQRQIELVRAAPEVELHLVCSAASGSRDLAAIADRYSVIRPDRLLITKVDEAVAPGSLLSATAGLGIPVSCVCNGQRVPEDIHAVTRKDLVDLVLGSWQHERT